MPSAREDLPLPETPATPTIFPSGISTSMFLRLFFFAPRTSIATVFVLFMTWSCCNNMLHSIPQVRKTAGGCRAFSRLVPGGTCVYSSCGRSAGYGILSVMDSAGNRKENFFTDTPRNLIRRIPDLSTSKDDGAWERFKDIYEPALRHFVALGLSKGGRGACPYAACLCHVKQGTVAACFVRGPSGEGGGQGAWHSRQYGQQGRVR